MLTIQNGGMFDVITRAVRPGSARWRCEGVRTGGC